MTLEGALAQLLGAWRETRAIELATLIERVSARTERPPITGRSQRAVHEAWLAIRAANDPLDVDRLLAMLAHGNLTMARERIASLSTLAPDPRVAAGLEALITSPPSVAFVKSSSLTMWNQLFAELARIADPRTRSIDERLAWLAHDRALSPFDAGTLRARNTRALAQVAREIPAADALSAAQRVLCDEVEALLRATPVQVDPGVALLAKIYADPNDLGARAVYGDWLSEQGDPRGELIALQLARDVFEGIDVYRRDRKVSSRESALLRAHQSVWIGPLGSLLSDVTFERGFPYRGRLAPNVRLAALAIPEASTLVHLSAATNDPADGTRLAAPPFHHLRAVSGIGWAAFEGLASAPTRPAIVAVRVGGEGAVPSRLVGFSSPWPLERLELRTYGQATSDLVLAFMRTPLVRQLRALRVSHNLRDDRAFITGFVESAIQRLELETWSDYFGLTVERGDDGIPRTRIVVTYDEQFHVRLGAISYLRERAATWPRELVDIATLELDPDYAIHQPNERVEILATARGFSTKLEVTETKNAAR